MRASVRPDAAPILDLRVEELVLHGFARIDRHQLASAIERELARLLGEPAAHDRLRRRGAMGDSAAPTALDGGSFIVPHDAAPDAVGVQVAQAIWRGMASGAASGTDAPRGSQRTQLPNPGAGR
jgi:hypothetical protein